MTAKPLLPQQPVTAKGDAPSRDLVEVIQRIVQDVDLAATDLTALDGRVDAIEAGTIAASLIRRQAVVTASGQTTLAQTGVPTWANRVQAVLSLISTNGTSDLLLQVGNGFYVTTGYVCNYQGFTGGATGTLTSPAGFLVDVDNVANTQSGTITLERHPGTNRWIATGMVRRDGASLGFLAGEINLGGALDRIRLNTVNGTDTFDAGTVSFSWE